MTRILITIIAVVLFGCNAKTTQPVSDRQLSSIEKPLATIALGSCDRQNLPQDFWQDVIANKPDLWIWLGDNIYGDSEDMSVLAAKYEKQKSHPLYQQLRATTPIIGIWDDHDYGVNDGDKNYPKKVESKALMLDFLDVPTDAPVRTREGAYQSYTLGPKGKRIKVILLDTRYFRDELQKGEGDDRRRYLPNPTGDMLGEAQWQWLEQELANSDAQIHLIGSGVQIISAEHPYEKWSNFPAARQRLFDLIAKTKPNKTILLSGDRHTSEVSKIDLPGLGYSLYDFTSSGLTHAYTGANASEEPNQYRVGTKVNDKSFGILRIDWSGAMPEVTAEMRGWGNHLFGTYELK